MTMQAGWTVHIVESGTVGAADQVSAIVGMVTLTANGAAATILDGSQPIAYSAIVAGGTDAQITLDYGVEVETHISVQATLGVINGVIWYLLEEDVNPKATTRKG
jgi:hypothetical protein